MWRGRLLLVAVLCSAVGYTLGQEVFLQQPTPVEESAGSVEICAVVSGGDLDSELTVNLTFTDGTATMPDDYSPASDTLVFPNGTMSGETSCTNVTIVNDDVLECDQYFTVEIASTSPNVTVGTPLSVTVTIQDTDDASSVTVAFEQTTYTPSEGDGTTQVCVVVSGLPTGGLECEIVVTLATMDGDKAAVGSDFTVADPLMVTFPTTSASGDTACADISILDDDAFEGDHSFTVNLTSTTPTGVTIGTDSSTTVTIQDNDVSSVEFQQTTYTVSEGDGTTGVCVVVSDVPTGGLECEIVVTLTTMDGDKAVEDSDFSVADPLTVTFPTTSASGDTACANITIVDDDVLEGDHSFTVQLTSTTPTGVTIGTDSSTTVTIQDNDVSSVEFQQTTYNVSEGDGTTEVCVVVSVVPAGGLECEIVVTLATMDGDKAVVGNDFTVADPLMVTFPTTSVSEDTACADITIVDDDVLEGDHSFTVQLTSTTPTGVTIGTDSSTTVTIQDNDVSSVEFQQTTYNVSEGDGTTEVCVVVSDVPAGGLECEIVVTLTTMDGDKAVEDSDFSVADPLTVTFNSGTTSSGDTACADITILDDDALEGDHSFTVQLTSTTPTGVTIGTDSSTTVTIQDNDVSSVEFQQTTYNVSEGDGTTEVCVVVSVVPAGGLECEIVVTLTTMDGDKAVVGNDFTVADPLTVTFPTTSVSEDTACADITIVDDDVLEGDHSFTVQLTSTTPTGVTIGTDSSTTVTIQDNDVSSVTVAFEQSNYTVSEGDGTTQVCVEVSGIPAGGLECEIVVTLSPSNDTAVQGIDYSVVDPLTVTFPTTSVSGDTACAAITILDDDVVGDDTSFFVHLTGTTPSGVTFGSHLYTIMTIQDDDEVTIGFEPSVYTVSEAAGLVEVCAVNVSGTLARSVTVTFTPQETGSATGADFSTAPINATFEVGDTSQCVNITIASDSEDESSSETFTVMLSSVDPAVVFNLSTAMVEIFDPPAITSDPLPQINIVPGMNVSFTVVASGSNLNYQWQNDSGDLPGSMAATLDVINVMEGDAGEYRCVVSNAVGSVMSMAAQLSILGAPTITSDPQDVVVESGMNVTFSCTAEGSNVSITWATSANATLPDPDDTKSMDGMVVTSTIMLMNATPSYRGDYLCTARNNRSEDTSTPATLTVIEIPEIRVSPNDPPITLARDVTLDCSSSGSPNLTYSWTVDAAVRNPPLDLSVDKLVINNTGTSDQGTYSCSVSEGDTLVGSRSVELTTRGPTFIMMLDPTVILTQNTLLMLRVVAQNNLDAPNDLQFLWFHNGMRINATDRTDRPNLNFSMGANENATSTLTVDKVEDIDSGDYTVKVTNRMIADAIITSTIVTVQFIPEISGFPMTEQRLTLNENFTMMCDAEAEPPVTFIEIRGNDIQVNGTGAVTVTLTDLEFSDSGIYSCIATNGNETVKEEFNLIVQDRPEAVDHDSIDATIMSLRSVFLTWNTPVYNFGPIRSYIVAYCVLVNSICPTNETVTNTENAEDPSLPEITLSDLNPDRSYQITIVAVNDVGRGLDPAEPASFLSATAMDVRPEEFLASPITDTEVFLSWTINDITKASEPDNFVVTYVLKGDDDPPNSISVDYDASSLPAGVLISGLMPFTDYIFRVYPYFANTFSNASYPGPSAISNATAELDGTTQMTGDLPEEIPEPSTTVNSDNSITITWDKLPVSDEFLEEYEVAYSYTRLVVTTGGRRKRQDSGSGRESAGTTTSFTLNNPEPYSEYTLQVFGNYRAGDNIVTAAVTRQVTVESMERAPSEPRNLTVVDTRYTEIDLKWLEPVPPNGVIAEYTVYYRTAGSPEEMKTVEQYTPEDNYTLVGLRPNTEYSISVSASTGVGSLVGDRSNVITSTTIFGVVQPVILERIKSGDAFRITIDQFDDEKGDLSRYKIVVIRERTYQDTMVEILEPLEPEFTGNYYVANVVTVFSTLSQSHFTIGDGTTRNVDGVDYFNPALEPGDDYYVFIRLYSGIDETVFSDSDVNGPFSIPEDDEGLDPIPIIVPIAVVAALLFIIFIILVIVAFITRRPKVVRRHYFEDGNLDGKKRGKAVELRRTRVFSPVLNVASPNVFTSAGQPTTLICEASGTPAPDVDWTKDGEPLDKERFIQLADSSLFINDTDLQDEGSYLVMATNSAGSTEQLVRVTVIRPVPPEPDSEHPPIPLGDFTEKIALLQAKDNEGLEDEYADLELDWNFTSYAAKISVNKNKNRYVNIIPYDHSRVVLSLQDNTPGSDYINASYIDGYNKPNAYIGSQGPIPSTFPDYWRMIWELDSPTIVMVTNLKEDEKVKCNQYWPSYGTTTYGNIQVTLKEVENLAEYSIRTFNVTPLAGQSKAQMPVREVRQFHFLVWPDHGVPQYATALLSFRKRVHKYHPKKRGPMVVHCSAGVGRTGTFITVDYTLQQIEAEGVTDIFNFVRHMRYRRNYMVQTSPQYIFLHEAILESIMCGDTSIQAPEMREKVLKLQEVSSETGKTGFAQQFETLAIASPSIDDFDCSVAKLPDNMGKNRSKENVPPNDFRVTLSTENDQSDYICASLVDGYRQRNAFMVTQGPLATTIGDFWRMIWEHKSAAVVMLTQLEEGGEEMCVKYWPSEVGQLEIFGLYQVELSGGDRNVGDYITRRFKLSHVDKPQESRWITQFHFTKWPKSSSPPNSKSIIDLIDELQRVQRKSGNGPITVHCDDGVGRTGAFCSLYSVLERVKTEQVVDVFQAIKTLRIQRPGLLESEVQYEFVHSAVIEFLNSFADYQNFK